MSDLVEFLRVRLDEDELIARHASAQDGAEWTITGWLVEEHDEGDPWNYSEESREHVARWDPARVLAEVAAKRAVLDLESQTEDAAWERIALALVQPYADRPGFDPAWREEQTATRPFG